MSTVTNGWRESRAQASAARQQADVAREQAQAAATQVRSRGQSQLASARVGLARFSVENTPVLNIYASLGAQFLPPIGIWLWTRGA